MSFTRITKRLSFNFPPSRSLYSGSPLEHLIDYYKQHQDHHAEHAHHGALFDPVRGYHDICHSVSQGSKLTANQAEDASSEQKSKFKAW